MDLRYCDLNLRTLVLVVLLGAAPISSRAAAQSIRISSDLAPMRTGDVSRHLFTPDGSRLVYGARRAGNYEIFSVPTDGSAPSVRLNGSLPPGGQVFGLSFGAGMVLGAGDRVVYAADQTTQGVFELFSVPADASASPMLLSPSPTFTFWLNPAGDTVFFRDSASFNTLQRVPIDGSAAPGVVATFPSFPQRVLFSANGATALVILSGDLDTYRIYSVPADGGGPPVQLHQTPANGQFLSDVRFASDGVHAVFSTAQDEGQFPHFLFSVPIDGSSAAVRLDTAGLVADIEFEASSPQTRLAFQEGEVVYSVGYDGSGLATLTPPGWQSDFDYFGSPRSLEVHGSDVVFSAHTTAGGSVLRAPLDGSQVGVPLFPPAGLDIAYPEVLSSGTVVFPASDATSAGFYTVPLSGGTPHRISNRGSNSFIVHPNELELVFLSVGGLYAVPLDGSQAPRKLSEPLLQSGASIFPYELTPDGLAVAYAADPLIDNLRGVYRAPLDGLGPVTQYDEPATGSATGGDVLEFRTTHDGKEVVFRADAGADESFDLFVAGTLGRGRPRSLSALLPGTANVRPGFVLSPTEERVVFQSVEQSLFSLHSATTTPGPAPIELDSSTDELPLPLAISPDGTRAVYRKGASGTADYALWSVPVGGSSPPQVLHTPLSGRAVVDFQISPDTRFVVHRADEGIDNVFELFSAPLDGSAPPVRLHPPLAAGRTLTTYRISPDGARVVFLADREVAGRLDLYSVPTDGSFAPRKLDQTLLATRDVFDFAISPDGRAVVYRANALAQAQVDLYRVPIDGLVPPARGTSGEVRKSERVRLSQLGGIRQVTNFAFTSDGTQVLFLANSPVALSRFDLYRVAADGSSLPVPLTGVPSGRTVLSFALAPDQGRVVYLSDAAVDEVYELFSVPLAGGPAVRLGPLPSFGDVSTYRIDPLSRRVVYLADANVDFALELFDAPLDGSAPAERLNTPLPTNGDVESDFLPLLGGRTLYRADQTTNDVVELFLSLERPVLPR